jgi:hypothetical protein
MSGSACRWWPPRRRSDADEVVGARSHFFRDADLSGCSAHLSGEDERCGCGGSCVPDCPNESVPLSVLRVAFDRVGLAALSVRTTVIASQEQAQEGGFVGRQGALTELGGSLHLREQARRRTSCGRVGPCAKVCGGPPVLVTPISTMIAAMPGAPASRRSSFHQGWPDLAECVGLHGLVLGL